MAIELNRADEKDALLNDLLQETDELKEISKTQEERVSTLEEAQRDHVQKLEELYSWFSNRLETLGERPKLSDLSLLNAALEKGLEEIKEEVKKQHCQFYQTKYYSLFGDRYGSEHFKKVMDTTMKWVIILLVALNLVAIIKFLVHFK